MFGSKRQPYGQPHHAHTSTQFYYKNINMFFYTIKSGVLKGCLDDRATQVDIHTHTWTAHATHKTGKYVRVYSGNIIYGVLSYSRALALCNENILNFKSIQSGIRKRMRIQFVTRAHICTHTFSHTQNISSCLYLS